MSVTVLLVTLALMCSFVSFVARTSWAAVAWVLQMMVLIIVITALMGHVKLS